MPQQLIYTSAPRGLVAGRSGYCTVARSAAMRDPLVIRLEQLSRYVHVSLTGGKDHPVFASRLIDIRGESFHVLSRIQAAGLDYEGRNSNLIAHHIVFTPSEIATLPAPALILRDWTGWVESWKRDPYLIQDDTLPDLENLKEKSCLPPFEWQRLTGDAANACALLDCRPGAVFRVDDLPEKVLLGLLAESAELSALRDPRRNRFAAAWQQTFITSALYDDDRSEIRWCGLHGDSPVFAKFGGPDCPHLKQFRGTPRSAEETALVRTGWQKPRFVESPKKHSPQAGEPGILQARAEGVPAPAYQWYSVNKQLQWQIIPGQTQPVLRLDTPPYGDTRFGVEAGNCFGTTRCEDLGLISNSHRAYKLVAPNIAEPADVEENVLPVRPRRTPTTADREKKYAAEFSQINQVVNEKSVAEDENRRGILYLVLVVFVAAGLIAVVVFNKRGKNPSPPHIGDGITNQPFSGSVGSSNLPAASATITNSSLGTNTVSKDSLSTAATSNSNSSTPQTMQSVIKANEAFHGEPRDLPDAFHGQTIGYPNSFNKFGTNSSPISISGRGSGFYSDRDNFYYLNRPYSGPLDLTVTVSEVTALTRRAQIGVMLRESIQTNAAFIFLGMSFDGTNHFATEAARQKTGVQTSSPISDPIPDDGRVFLHLVYTNDLFKAFYNGNLMESMTNSPKLPTPFLLGFVVYSGANVTTSAEFDTTNSVIWNP